MQCGYIVVSLSYRSVQPPPLSCLGVETGGETVCLE